MIGELNTRLTFHHKALTADGQGGFSTIWGSLGIHWAKIETVKAYTRFQAKQVGQEITHKITARYTDTLFFNLDSGDRAFVTDFPETMYEILAVSHDDKKRWLYIEVGESKP